MRDVLSKDATDRALGLMAYGHNRKGDCTDIELLVPPAAGTAGQIIAEVEAINPKGKTPLSDAITQAARALQHTENVAQVIVVTDGLETCGANPCAVARELAQAGVDFTAHVVGFGLSAEQGAAVSCIAEETGGRFTLAGDAAALTRALTQTIGAAPPEQAPPPEPAKLRPAKNLQINVALTADHPPLEEKEISRLDLRLIPADGAEKRLGVDPTQSIAADPGTYTLRAHYQGGSAEMPLEVDAVEMTHATLVLNAGRGIVTAVQVPAAFDLDPALQSWKVTNLDTNKRFDAFVPQYDQVLGAGRYAIQPVIARKDAMSPPPVELTITPGDLSEASVTLPHARLRATPLDENGTVQPDHFIRVALHARGADGTKGRFRGGVNLARDAIYALPADYILTVEDWGMTRRSTEIPISIAPGQDIAVDVIMPADPDQPLKIILPN